MICLSSSGMNLFVHVCGERINNLSFSAADANCGMEKMYCAYSKNNTQKEFNAVNDCCKNYLIKNNLKVRSSEKIDNLDSLLNIHKISNYSPLSHLSIGHKFNMFEKISLYNNSINSGIKKGIYLFLQNFRN